VGEYEPGSAIDHTKLSPVRMPIGKATIGFKTKIGVPSTAPSPASYRPSIPHLKDERRHWGSKIGNSLRISVES